MDDDRSFEEISSELEKRLIIDPDILINAAQYFRELQDDPSDIPLEFILNDVLGEILIHSDALESPLWDDWLSRSR